jgi:hypothetical protein
MSPASRGCRSGSARRSRRAAAHRAGRRTEAGADYEVAATIDALDSLGAAGQDMLIDRDEIVERLKIERLPVLALAPNARP